MAKPTPSPVTAQDLVTTAAQNALQLAKQKVFGAKLTEQQVGLVCDQVVKKRTKLVLFIAAFIDLSGMVLLTGGAPLMCANAPGAIMGDVPGAFPASDFAGFGDAAGPPAMDFAMAVNLITVSSKFGSVFSNYLAGTASDQSATGLLEVSLQDC